MPVYDRDTGRDNRKRMSLDPGYAGVLPRVFPYRWKGSREDAATIIRVIQELDYTGFALTEHSSTPHVVSLWMSKFICDFLIDGYSIRHENVEET